MIALLTGTLLHKSPTEILVDVGGVGYQLNIPVTTFDRLPEQGEPVTLFTYLHVREDAMQLYGFAARQDKELFRKLITVSGVGPKLAQTIMSGLSYEELIRAIRGGDVGQLNKIAGIGKKTAERLVVDLRDKLPEIQIAEGVPTGRTFDTVQTEALLALTALGYSRPAAENAIRSTIAEANGTEIPIEELVKGSLRRLSR
jgi:holliday junction DNA helicase RuvA